MKKIGIVFIVVLLFGCKSSKLVAEYKNPDPVIFTAYKVLLVGMTSNQEMRVDFETKIKKEFDKRGVESMRSVDLFDFEYTASSKTEDELAEVEQQLLDKDFDAILFTKIIGSENKLRLKDKINKLVDYSDFKDDFLDNQGEYLEDNDASIMFDLYHTETTIYCICVDKDKSLIWRGNIDVKEANNKSKILDDYIKLIVTSMEDKDVIFRN